MTGSPALLVAPASGRFAVTCRDRYPSLAMAGGTQPEHLSSALANVVDWVKAKI